MYRQDLADIEINVSIFTCDTDTVNVVRDDTLSLNNFVQLRSCTMEDDGVQSDTVQETETQSKLIKLVENGTAYLDHSELGGLRRMRRRREDTQVALYLTLCTNGV